MKSGPRRILAVVVTVVMAGGLAAPDVLAEHKDGDKKKGSENVENIDGPHEAPPNPPIPISAKAECVFFGEVEQANVKLPNEPVHNHVTLTNLELDCRDLRPMADHFDQAFDVHAEAGSDGETDPLANPKDKPVKSDTHGATATQGWSHSNGYSCGSAWDGYALNTNKGDISAIGTKNATIQDCTNPWTESWFKFVQGWVPVDGYWVLGAPNVYAWGQLAWNDDKGKGSDGGKQLPNCFVAPTVAAIPPVLPGDPIQITGTAVIYDAYGYTDLKTGGTPDPTDKNQACDFQKEQFYDDSGSSGNGGGNGGGSNGSRGPNG